MGQYGTSRESLATQGLSKIEGLAHEDRRGVGARQYQPKRARSGQELGPGANGVSAVSDYPRPRHCNLLYGERYRMALDNSRVTGSGRWRGSIRWNVPPLPTRLRCVNLIWLSVHHSSGPHTRAPTRMMMVRAAQYTYQRTENIYKHL